MLKRSRQHVEVVGGFRPVCQVADTYKPDIDVNDQENDQTRQEINAALFGCHGGDKDGTNDNQDTHCHGDNSTCTPMWVVIESNPIGKNRHSRDHNS